LPVRWSGLGYQYIVVCPFPLKISSFPHKSNCIGMFPCSMPKRDIKALMNIEEGWFRRVTEDFLVMRRMILAHRSLMKTYIRPVNKAKALSERERITLKPAISSIEKQMDTLELG